MFLALLIHPEKTLGEGQINRRSTQDFVTNKNFFAVDERTKQGTRLIPRL